MDTPTPRPPHLQELTLEWIPQATRRMMDGLDTRISLWQWQKLALADRQLLARMAEDPHTIGSNFLRVLQAGLASADAGTTRSNQAPGGAARPPAA